MMQLLVLLSAILFVTIVILPKSRFIITIEFVRHLIYFVNPLLHLFPQDPLNNDDPIPLPRPFTLVSLVLHANLLLLLDPTSVRNILLRVGIRIDDHVDLRSYTLSPTLSYTLALVAPSICLFLRRSWWTIAWWSITIIITYAVQLVLDSISTGDERITSLEAMRYRAPGA